MAPGKNMRGTWRSSAVLAPGEEAIRDEFSDGERVLFWWRSVRVGQAIALSALVMLTGIYLSAAAVMVCSKAASCLRQAIFKLRMGHFKRRAGLRGCRDGVGSTREGCAICLEAHRPGDAVLRLGCGHAFHERCALEWVRVSNACPVCKAAVVYDDGAEAWHHKFCTETCVPTSGTCRCAMSAADVDEVRDLFCSRRLRIFGSLVLLTWLFLTCLETVVYDWTNAVINETRRISAETDLFHDHP